MLQVLLPANEGSNSASCLWGRRVRLVEPCPLGRDAGVIASIRKELGWGFIRCATMDTDLYFRVDEGEAVILITLWPQL